MIKFASILLLFCHLCLANDSIVSNESTSNSVESDENVDRRIIGGTTAKPGQFPYVAKLTPMFLQGSAICTGTVISYDNKNIVILTAAHCIQYNGNKAMFIRAEFIDSKTNDSEYIYFEPEEMFVYPSYGRFVNDIAILKTTLSDFPIDFGTLPSLPCDSVLSDMYTNSNATVIGWGKTSDTSNISPTLQYANVNLLPNDDCRKVFGRYITPNILCTLNRNSRICGGDSGGPLLMKRGCITYIIGVNAFGASRCEAYRPSGYTRVSSYLDWIKQYMPQ